MPATFRSLALLLEKVEATKKRLEIINETANYLKTLDAREIQVASNMIVGHAFPQYSQKNLDVNWLTLSLVLQRMAGPEWLPHLRQAMTSTGDIGSAVKLVLEQTQTKKQTQLIQNPLTITEVQNTFEVIAHTRGVGGRTKKELLITTLLSRTEPVEAKYLIKIFTGEMRTGLHEGLMERAVSSAFGVPLSDVQHAAMVLGDIGEVASVIRSGGLTRLVSARFNVFRPVELMLAQISQSVREALEEHGGTSAFEYKYDGVRVQIHQKGDRVEIFSRRLNNVTSSLPEVVKTVKMNIHARSAIVEGEVIAFDSAGYPIAFQHLMRRFRRIRGVSGFAEKMPITLYLFDVLYLNGDSLITKPYINRRQILAETAGKIALSKQIVTDSLEHGEVFLKEALASGHEGLMAKKLDSPYTPGRRGKRWLKIKIILEPLDLVITAAEYGYGRRKGWLSDYYLAARDPQSGEFLDVGKTFKGLTDAEITELTRRLKESTVFEGTHKVAVIPKIVVEVVYNEIQHSPRYKSRMALRFARITRIREDKSPQQASTIDQVKEIYDRQFRNKGKYTGGG
jgi:DNA ligase 1